MDPKLSAAVTAQADQVKAHYAEELDKCVSWARKESETKGHTQAENNLGTRLLHASPPEANLVMLTLAVMRLANQDPESNA